MDTKTFIALKKTAERHAPTAMGNALAQAFKKLEHLPSKTVATATPQPQTTPVRQANGFRMY